MQVRLVGKQNIYIEIAEQYKHFIDMNVLKQDEKLPSCRVLALELGINPNTVERAYSILEEDGYIVTLPKKGAFVRSRTEQNIDILKEVKKQINHYRNIGISYEQLSRILQDAYNYNEAEDNK